MVILFLSLQNKISNRLKAKASKPWNFYQSDHRKTYGHLGFFWWWFINSGFLGGASGKAAAAKSLQSCPTLCNPWDGSPPGSPVPGILQARTLECVAISFSNAWKWKVKVKLLSRVRLLATPWTAIRRHKRRGFHPWVRKVSWRRARQPTPVLLPGESHGQRSLASYSPQGHTDLDMTKAT